jgi:DNA-binding XRE family transcriptional regulator
MRSLDFVKSSHLLLIECFPVNKRLVDDSLGRRLRSKRLRRQLTQKQLADKVGVTRQQISNIEHGRSEVPASQLRRLSEVLKCDVRKLL